MGVILSPCCVTVVLTETNLPCVHSLFHCTMVKQVSIIVHSFMESRIHPYCNHDRYGRPCIATTVKVKFSLVLPTDFAVSTKL